MRIAAEAFLCESVSGRFCSRTFEPTVCKRPPPIRRIPPPFSWPSVPKASGSSPPTAPTGRTPNSARRARSTGPSASATASSSPSAPSAATTSSPPRATALTGRPTRKTASTASTSAALGFGNGAFLALGGDPGSVGGSAPFVATSPTASPGPTTTPSPARTSSAGSPGAGRDERQGLFVAVGDRGRRAASTDGLHWNDAPDVKAIDTLIDVAFGKPAGARASSSASASTACA